MNIKRFKKLMDGDRVKFAEYMIDPEPGVTGTIRIVKRLREGDVTRVDVIMDDGTEPVRVCIGDCEDIIWLDEPADGWPSGLGDYA